MMESYPIKILFETLRNTVEPDRIESDLVFHYSLPVWHETGDGQIEDPSELASLKLLLDGGEILVSKLNPEKGAVIHAQCHVLPVIGSTEFIALKPRGVDGRFGFWLMQSAPVRAQLEASVESVTNSHKRARVDKFLASHVLVPDLPTQKCIGNFLDRETARIDALIVKKERLLEVLKARFDALVRDSVTKGFGMPGMELRCSGIDYLGFIPDHWSVEKIGWRYSIQLGKMLDGAKQTGQHERPYLRVADVQWDAINTDDLPVMDFSADDQKKFQLKPGDLLVNEGGSYVGRSAIWRGAADAILYQKALHRLRPHNVCRDSTEFMLWLMWFATKEGIFVANGNQTTIDHLTAEAFRAYRFAFPPFVEQESIARKLRDARTLSADLEGRTQSSIDSLREYRAALITAAVTCQIEVSDYDDFGRQNEAVQQVTEGIL